MANTDKTSTPFESLYAFAHRAEYQGLVKALGELTLNFSLLHYAVEDLAYKMTGLTFSKGSLIFGQMMFGTLRERAQAIAKDTYPPDTMATLAPLFVKAKDVNQRRNNLVHALWLTKEGSPIHAFDKHTLNLVATATSEQVTVLNKEIVELADQFLSFKATYYHEVIEPIPPSS